MEFIPEKQTGYAPRVGCGRATKVSEVEMREGRQKDRNKELIQRDREIRSRV